MFLEGGVASRWMAYDERGAQPDGFDGWKRPSFSVGVVPASDAWGILDDTNQGLTPRNGLFEWAPGEAGRDFREIWDAAKLQEIQANRYPSEGTFAKAIPSTYWQDKNQVRYSERRLH